MKYKFEVKNNESNNRNGSAYHRYVEALFIINTDVVVNNKEIVINCIAKYGDGRSVNKFNTFNIGKNILNISDIEDISDDKNGYLISKIDIFSSLFIIFILSVGIKCYPSGILIYFLCILMLIGLWYGTSYRCVEIKLKDGKKIKFPYMKNNINAKYKYSDDYNIDQKNQLFAYLKNNIKI